MVGIYAATFLDWPLHNCWDGLAHGGLLLSVWFPFWFFVCSQAVCCFAASFIEQRNHMAKMTWHLDALKKMDKCHLTFRSLQKASTVLHGVTRISPIFSGRLAAIKGRWYHENSIQIHKQKQIDQMDSNGFKWICHDPPVRRPLVKPFPCWWRWLSKETKSEMKIQWWAHAHQKIQAQSCRNMVFVGHQPPAGLQRGINLMSDISSEPPQKN